MTARRRAGCRRSGSSFSDAESFVPTGTVKWYDPEKGFGFISRDEGGPDLFVHRSALGLETLGEGDQVEFEAGSGLKGPAATSVTVLERNANPVARRSSSSSYGSSRSSYDSYGGGQEVDVSNLPVVTGTVKRYDAIKGFGFISPDDGGADVFVHRSAAGYGGLQEGDRVEFHLADGAKGPRAEQVKIL
jgi:CspA family cold shock protein